MSRHLTLVSTNTPDDVATAAAQSLEAAITAGKLHAGPAARDTIAHAAGLTDTVPCAFVEVCGARSRGHVVRASGTTEDGWFVDVELMVCEQHSRLLTTPVVTA